MSKLVEYGWTPHYYLRYKDSNGCNRKISTKARSEAEALRFQAEFDAEQEAAPTEEQQTISKLMDAYLADRKGNVIAYDSLKYASVPIKEHFGHAQPRQVTDLQVKQFIKKMEKLGRSNGNTIKQLVTLRSALSFAVRKDWIEKAPYIQLPPRPTPKDRWLTKEEANKLLDGCKSFHVKLFILLALKTGARKSAILQLTWDRVSFERGIIMYPLPGRNHDKKRRAIVPISDSLHEILLDAQELGKTKWVIEFRDKPLLDIKNGFKTALQASEIDHCTIHDLRRTCATWLVQAGIPTSQVARMLGDTEKMIETTYGHHSPEYLKEAVNALDWVKL